MTAQDIGSVDGDRADWSMLALAWVLYFCFSLTVASLFPIVGVVREDLGLTYAQVGIVLGGWQLVYLVAAIPVGHLVDRFDTRLVLFVGTVVVALSQVARSYADGFVTLFLAVALLGLGGPVMSVGLPKVVAEFFTGRHRATASGVYITGAHVGQMTALAATLVVVDLVGGWRTALRVLAVVVLVVAVAWLLLAKPVPRAVGTDRPTLLVGLRHVVAVPGIWLVIAVGFAGFLGSHGYRSWLPELLVAQELTPTQAGLTAAVPALFGMAGSILVLRFGAGRRRGLTAMTLLAVTGAAMLGVTVAHGPLLLALEGFCAAALMPLMMNTLMEMKGLGPRHMGAAAGLYFTIGEMGGFAGPAAVGVLVGATGSFVAGVLALATTMWLMMLAAARMPLPMSDHPMEDDTPRKDLPRHDVHDTPLRGR